MKYIGSYSDSNDIATKANVDAVANSIPTKTSDIANDSGYITSAEAPVQSVNGKTGAVTLTKDDVGLGNVDDVTALPLAGGTMSGIINMGGLKITNVANPSNATDAANKAYADSQKGVEAVLSASQPTSQVSGDMWFQET